MNSCHDEGPNSGREHPPRDMNSSETGHVIVEWMFDDNEQ
eukprot:gene18833-biopygen5676